MTVVYPSSFDRSAGASVDRSFLLYETDDGLNRARRTLEGAGMSDAVQIRLDDTERALAAVRDKSFLWIELERASADVHAFLTKVDEASLAGRCSAVVAAPEEMIDPITAALSAGEIEIAIGPNEADRAAAQAIAVARSRSSGRVLEKASDENAARIRQLSEEIGRIATTLARLSGESGTGYTAGGTERPPTDGLPQVAAEQVRSVIRARRARTNYFPNDLFADPAWDMLLDLLQAELVQHRVPVSSLCVAAAVPATTALRWLKSMTDRGMLARRADPHDGRRVFIEMTPSTSFAIRRYFAEANPVGA